MRCCCGTNRPFDIDVFEGLDDSAPVMLSMHRHLACAPGSCCCQQTISIRDYSSKHDLGKAYVPFFCCTPQINVVDEHGNEQYEIEKDGCGCFGCCSVIICESCRSVPFNIRNKNGEDVGKIVKKWGGLGMEALSDLDTFVVNFPNDASAKQRALLLGATFLLDINFFERDNKKETKPEG